jgi:hypothetical protein
VKLTDHFRQMETGPTEAFLAALGQALRSRLRRSGLQDHPPAFLGYPEFKTWPEAFQEGDASASPTLDCYIEAIANRYGALMDQLRIKPNIDGLILLNIDRFILARQKKHDPIGYAVFKNAESSLQWMMETGQVKVDNARGTQLRNASVVHFSEGAVRGSREQLETIIAGSAQWEQALPRQIKIGEGAQKLLTACLLTFPSSGVGTFRLGDFLAVVKERVREIHHLRNRPADSETAFDERGNENVRRIIRTVGKTPSYEEYRECFDALRRRMQEAIGTLDVQERTREGIRCLFEELCRYADSDEDTPSWAEIARRLGARHSTLWDHLERLRQVLEKLVKSP